MLNKNFWKNKKVFITGHTGFKGGWLSVILHQLGCEISGYSLNPYGKNNFFNSTKIKKNFKNDFRKNLINFKELKKSIKKSNPEIIFHLAAQSSVIESFKNSKNTILSNVVGTTNILEAIKNNKRVKCVIIVTTDKVYENLEKKTYFNESSRLGGEDVYSGSKAACDIITHSYNKSFFSNSSCNIATVRAGNCIGGGDWTKDRIVKDCLESFAYNKNLIVRKPDATRPWQHVMEPLYGYLFLAQKLFSKNGKKYSGAWNFGPNIKQNLKVIDLAKLIKKKINTTSKIIIKRNKKVSGIKNFKYFESKYLSINSNKSKKRLNWRSFLTINQALNFTVEWYLAFKEKKNLLNLTKEQVLNYRKKI